MSVGYGQNGLRTEGERGEPPWHGRLVRVVEALMVGDEQHDSTFRGPYLLRDWAALAAGEAAAKVAGFVAFAYLARVLEPGAYGAVELAAALVLFSRLFVHFGFGTIGAREVARNESTARMLAAQIPAGRLILLCLVAVILCLLIPCLRQSARTNRLLGLFALSLIFSPWHQAWLLQGLRMMKWIPIVRVIRMSVFAGGVVLWVRGAGEEWKVGVVEIGAACAGTAVFLLVQQFRLTPVRLSFKRKPLVRLFRSAAPVGFSRVAWSLNWFLPMALVASLSLPEQTGRFGAAFRIVLSLNTFVILYHFNLFPWIARSADLPKTRFADFAGCWFRVAAWVGISGGLAGSLLAEPVCVVVFGPAFRGAACSLCILIWLIPIALLSGHSRHALIAYGRQRYALFAQAAGVMVTLGLGAVLIPRAGPEGAAVSMLASGVTVWAVAHRYARNFVGRLPCVGPVIIPVGLALLGAGMAHWLGESIPWGARVVLAVAIPTLGSPCIDLRLLRDARRILGC